jgi:large conductance mechanosensitive channel
MRKLIKDFGDFVNKGNVITIAVGLVMALYFQKIIEALLDGVINPIIAAIFGKDNFTEIGFDIGDARISIGLVIDAIISFIVVAFILFLIINAYNRMRPKGEPDASLATEVALLAEIRDLLASRRP